MDCNTIICLYLKGYISDEQFKNIFYNWSEVEKKLPQDTTILKAVLDRKC